MLCIMAFGQKNLASESLASEPEMFWLNEIKPLLQFVTNILLSFLKMKLTPPVKRSEHFCKSNLLPLFGEVKMFQSQTYSPCLEESKFF